MYIPSNYTLEEMIKYVSLPEEVVAKLEEVQDKLFILEQEKAQADRLEERLREQVQFRDDYISDVIFALNRATSKAELVEAKRLIKVMLEESYIELDNNFGVL